MPDLTGWPALDVAIGLALFFLLLSTLCSVVQEMIASFFKLRAGTLEEGLRNLLNDPAPPDTEAKDFAEEIYNHPLVVALWRDGRARQRDEKGVARKTSRRRPSYIPTRTFAIALMDATGVGKATADRSGPAALPDVIESLEAGGRPKEGQPSDLDRTVETLPDELRRALLALARDAGGDVDRLRRSIEGWFDDAMERVSGWYTRKARWWLAGIAAAVTIGANADTFLVAETLWKEEPVRAAVVTRATKIAESRPPDGQTLEEAADDAASVKQLGIPLGWPDETEKDPRAFTWRKIPGWIVTWLALLAGAPFWFDVMKRLVNLRSDGGPAADRSTDRAEPART
ncbi:MAG: hypothetical protein M3340_13135 [Actinomycetota bacterium]|nr:hypothetical protein [Actinomycetota bacterium]